MKETEYKKGGAIKIVCPNEVLKSYIEGHIFSGLGLESIRLYSLLVDNKKYKIVDVCHPCKRVKIEIKGKWLSLKYNQITKI